MHSCVHLGQGTQKVKGRPQSCFILSFTIMNLENQWTTSGLTFSGTYNQTTWESSFSLDLSQLFIDNFYNLPSENPLCLLKDFQVFETIYKLTIMHLDYVHR